MISRLLLPIISRVGALSIFLFTIQTFVNAFFAPKPNSHFPVVQSLHKKVSNQLDLSSWIVGFTDGEGCFSVSFSKREKMKLGIEVRPSFSIAQNSSSKFALEKIETFFECGAIRRVASDNTYRYEVRSIEDLMSQIVPFFKKYNLQTSKREDFVLFTDICYSIKKGDHLNSKGLLSIIEKAYQMNPSGKRNYSEEELIHIIDERVRDK